MEDSKGNIWFGTRYGGLSRYDGKNFTNYTTKDGIGNNEVCVIYEDKEGNIWFSSEGYGVYRYNASPAVSLGESLPDVKEGFTNYSQEQGLGVRAVQTIFEDKEGRLWVGGGGGLYRYEVTSLPIRQEGFINVTKNGPWK
jgi:ligand-binding sensor domain-containing protein